MQLEIRDKSYHVAVHQHHGNLPLLVLLHGFMGSGQVFDHLINNLKEFSNPVTVDQVGHGNTEGATDPKRFQSDEQVNDLHEVLNHFSADDIILHGYSMGGRLALQYALTHPNSISGLILESTTYGIARQRKRQERQKLDKQRAVAIETDYNEFLRTWDQLPLFNKDIQVPGSLLKHYRNIQARQQPLQMANSLRGFGTGSMPSAEKKLNRLTMPVLILAGEADEKYRLLAREMDRIITDSRASIIEKAGHRIHLENPKAFVLELKSFLNEVSDL